MSAREKDDVSRIVKFLKRDPEPEIVVNKLENEHGLEFNDLNYDDSNFPESARLMKEYAAVKLQDTENHRYAEGIY